MGRLRDEAGECVPAVWRLWVEGLDGRAQAVPALRW